MTSDEFLELADSFIGKSRFEIAIELGNIYYKGQADGIDKVSENLKAKS